MEKTLLEELAKSLYIKVVNRKKITEPFRSNYSNEIIFTVVVYKKLFVYSYLKTIYSNLI